MFVHYAIPEHIKMILYPIFLTTSFAMKKAHKYIQILSFFLIFITPGCFFINAQDSTTVSHELKELVVKDKRAIVENDKVVFIPNKKEKKLSNSPETLLKSMHLPMLLFKGESVTTLTGETVSYFINGVPMSATDLATFWPSEVAKVEYIPNPTDPRYEGVKIAINFVKKQYEVGGITRINGFQRFPNNGIYQAASRLEYKNMSLGLMAKGSYSRDHRSKETSGETYKDLFFQQKHYTAIERTYEQHDYTRDNGLDIAFNAKYQTKKTLVSHTLSFRGTKNLGSGNHAVGAWSPSLFNSSESFSQTEGKSISPQIVGRYFFDIAPKWALNVKWGYTYGHNEKNLHNALNIDTPVSIFFNENVNSAQVMVVPVFYLKNNMQIRLYLESGMDWFKTDYKGSTIAKSHQMRGTTSSKFSFIWNPIGNLGLTLTPGLVADYWTIGSDNSETMIRPMLNGSLNWSYKKWMFDGSITWYTMSPEASESNDIVIKGTDLLWYAGNPTLRNLTAWSAGISASWFPFNWFNASIGTHYERSDDSYAMKYEPAASDMGGLIRTYMNASDEDFLLTSLSLSFNPLKNLSFSIVPSWMFQKTRGIYKSTLNDFNVSADIDYQLGNCSLNISYEPKSKSLSEGGAERYHKTSRCNIGFKYGNGNFFVSAKVEDIFHKYEKRQSVYTSEYYTSYNNRYLNGRCFTINVTYTFGYGKKVKDASVDSPTDAKSSFLE